MVFKDLRGVLDLSGEQVRVSPVRTTSELVSLTELGSPEDRRFSVGVKNLVSTSRGVSIFGILSEDKPEVPVVSGFSLQGIGSVLSVVLEPCLGSVNGELADSEPGLKDDPILTGVRVRRVSLPERVGFDVGLVSHFRGDRKHRDDEEPCSPRLPL